MIKKIYFHSPAYLHTQQVNLLENVEDIECRFVFEQEKKNEKSFSCIQISRC
jgi:hypothetical protein